MQQDVKSVERTCEHVVLPTCRAYQYSVSAGGDRVTVVAMVENPYMDKMLSVSLCLSVIGIRTDCRSAQAEEIPAGEQRQIAATATFSSSSSSSAVGCETDAALRDIMLECLVLWASPARPEDGASGEENGEHASILLSLDISPEERLMAPVPGPHTLRIFPWDLAVSATVCIYETAVSGCGGAGASRGGVGLEGLRGHRLMQMLAALFNASASSQTPPPGTTALYAPGGGDDPCAIRANVWVALALKEVAPQHTVLQVYAMDEVALGLALQTMQRHLPEVVAMTWRKLPLMEEECLLNRAIESLVQELEWGLEQVESMEPGLTRGDGAGFGTEWLRLQIETDDAVTQLGQI